MTRWTGLTTERAAAAGIIVLAVLLAWAIVGRPVVETPPPPKHAAAPPKVPDEKASEPAATVAAIAGSLAIELVQISEPPAAAAAPAPAPTPAPSAAPAPPPAPVPAPKVVAEAAPPPPPLPLVPEVKAAQVREPEAVVEPKRQQEWPPEIVPLRPTVPQPPEPAVMPVALKPETKATTMVEPLRPTPMRPTPPRPQAEPPVVQRTEPRERPPAPEVTPMRPSPPKPPPLPETRVVETAPPPRPTPPVAKSPPQKSAPPKPSPQANVAMVVGEGRAFLKILEQGAGPGIEIRWPSEASQRDRLYDVLVQCLGMRTGVLDADGRLYLGDGQKGQPSMLDGERYSGFVRRPEGVIASDEEREIGRVRSYHQVRASASAARIFPRRVDAYLIGGLRQLVGENYLKTKSIRASYRLRNGQAIVESISADGRPIVGQIELAAVANSCSL